MKVCKLKTGRIIETQFGEDAEVLLKNAQFSHPNQEVEVIDMLEDDFNIAIKIQNENDVINRIKTNEEKIQEIKVQLNELDLKAIRPLLDNEINKIEEIKAQKLLLRTELQTLL